MNRVACLARIVAFASLLILSISCSGRGDVDLSKATPLTAEPVASGPAAGLDPNPGTPHSLFSLTPGKWYSFNVLGGVIDPVGTTLEQDFDGDGINNGNERTSNIWVADYPVIESEIAPPVTMKIEILKTTNQSTSTIDTNLTSDNFESRKNEGSEKFHQDEVNVKTINNGSTTDTSSSSSTKEVKASVSAGAFGLSASVSAKSSSTSSSSNTTVRQTFEDRPFVNNIDRAALSTKADAAEKKARDYRGEKREAKKNDYVTKSDGGIVRAALYIKNRSINMPVKLSNILCSLVFETSTGSLIPMESFRLRNDDFSLFEAEIYGNSEFGPYVIELKNLNTVEIENALALGYTPKIFIVDYKMAHVQDSNYRTSLGVNFAGDNLKIIEENAKGRTALLKLIYPDYRNMFRIVAYDSKFTSTGTDICNPDHIDVTSPQAVSPGLAMTKYLQRLKCSGIDVQFDHYIYDFTGVPNTFTYPRVYTYAVKSVNGRSVTAPCTSSLTGTIGYNELTGLPITQNNVCVIKVADLTEQQLDSLSLWVMFNNGKYSKSGDVAKRTNGDEITFDGVPLTGCSQQVAPCGIPVLKGVNSTVWAGDNYDLVYMRLVDFLSRQRTFGKNPLEAGTTLSFNTKWDLAQLDPNQTGVNPFDPEVKSIYLGKAGLGDQVQITFNLKDTTFLNPDFGFNLSGSTDLEYSKFTYNPQKATKKFTVDEAIDFELSMGIGGTRNDWQNIMRPPPPTSAVPAENENIEKVSATLDYLEQKFTVTVKLPTAHHLVGSDGLVKLYLRPALSNAYRNAIWPQDYTKVKKYDATVHADAATGSAIQINSGIGSIDDLSSGNAITVVSNGVPNSYTLNAPPVPDPAYGYVLNLTSPLIAPIKAGDRVYGDANLSAPEISLNFDYTTASDNFFTAFNGGNSLFPERKLIQSDSEVVDCSVTFAPTKCYGYNSIAGTDYVVSNWLGNAGFDNNWVDGGRFTSWADRALNPLAIGRFDSYLNGATLVSGQLGSFGVKSLNPKLTANSASELLTTPGPGSNSKEISSAISGNLAFFVWSSFEGTGFKIRGQMVNVDTDTPIGGSILISTTNIGEQGTPKVVISGKRALVVWYAREPTPWFTPRGRIIDTTTGLGIGNDFLIPSTALSGDAGVPSVAVGGSIALVVFTSDTVRGRYISLAPGAEGLTQGLDFPLSPGGGINPAVAAYGDRAVVAFSQGSSATIRARVFGLAPATLGPLGGEFPLNTPIAAGVSGPIVGMSKDRAVVSWRFVSDGVTHVRGIDTTGSGSAIGNDINFSTNMSFSPMRIGVFGTRALLVSNLNSGTQQIWGRFFDMPTGSAIGAQFQISVTTSTNTGSPNVGLFDNRAFVTWSSQEGSNFRTRARVIDTVNGAPLDVNDILVSNTTNSGVAIDPQIVVSGHRAMFGWVFSSPGNGFRRRTYKINPNYGLNNFFTAPLIERNFTASAQIAR